MALFNSTYQDDIITTIFPKNATNMNMNASHVPGVSLIYTKTIIGDEYNVIEDPKVNKTTDLIDFIAVQVAFCILYSIIFILGVFGNVLVCFVVFRNRAMQTVTNLFITNLALSDILLCVFAVPLTPMYTFLGRWVFGRLLCHLMPYAQGTSVYISTLTLTSIAIDRFFVIIYPFHPRMKLNTCIFIIVFIWIFSLVVTCPYGLFMGIQITNNKTYCEESWPADRSRRIFGVFTSVLQFVIPFLVIAICYTCVSIRLNDRARSKPGAKNTRREEADRDRKKRTNRMLISMVAIFGISWLPINVINIFNDFYAAMTEWNYYYMSFFLAHSMAMASTCYNPFLYAWLNENFRKEFKQVLPFFESTGGVRTSYHSGRMPTHKSDKICNGNDTIQETLLASSFNRGPSLKHRMLEGNGRKDGVEIENIILEDKPISASYNTKNENVNLQLIDEESQLSESKDGKSIVI
ncbi:prolactin-releasing peptide receptor-like [Leguminivora glycinivorella]|uniref:prolactin-releasing peptide receptor-like n=1 Tax=Leguminivora glycinivorella TaxID=1035111 RepID=UPI00200C7616|nr:prolactin-releasing peptide receptor-like [Leguminivora glycinivorella]XP_047993782.1 prolactin-releasing peptide receptor-like [Leguminivora glycinivorella]